MANFPGTSKTAPTPTTPTTPPAAPPTTPPAPEVNNTLSFEDGAMPSQLEVASATNPFQMKVNEIDKNVRAGTQPSASSVLVKDADVDATRAKIRAACAKIDRGAVTTPIPEKTKPGMTRVWFSTKEKTNRARK